MRIACLITLLALSTALVAQDHPKNFKAAKKALAKLHEGTHTTFYCGCNYKIQPKQSDAIEMDSCNLSPRKSEKRANDLEWEHIVPASWFHEGRWCARDEVREVFCKSSSGTVSDARKCCDKLDSKYRAFESDLYNLRPAAGEINGDRSNRRYGEVTGEGRSYGACDMEVSFESDLAEPATSVRGNVARAVFYMAERYGFRLSREEMAMYQRWHEADPVDAAERDLAERTATVQGNRNRFVVGE
jgi:deoxyribonuclease-1